MKNKIEKLLKIVRLTLAGQAGYPLTLANTKSPTLNVSFLPIFRSSFSFPLFVAVFCVVVVDFFL